MRNPISLNILPAPAGYEPGVCNIGPEEIAMRRRSGHISLAATLVTLGVLIAIGAPPLVRLIVALPAAAAATGYLQAQLHFCAGFGSRGVYNFGPRGESNEVADLEARRRDRAQSTRILIASLVIGVAAGIAAVLLPL